MTWCSHNTLMTTSLTIFVSCILLIHPLAATGQSPGFDCAGYSSIIFSDQHTMISICHSPHLKINRKQLHEWQDCVDAMIYSRNKQNQDSHLLADCKPTIHKQFKVENNELLIKHFYNSYPGFTPTPLLLEKYSLKSLLPGYEILAKHKIITKNEIQASILAINTELGKPFDGKTFFTTIYSNLDTIRNFSFSNPEQSLAILKDYYKREVFDGEVAETLTEIIDDVELIQAALASRPVKQTHTK
ncbi:MAG: hypothetical protein OEZ38_10745 [Gammaproteobacteria bacterium]|nr:hypothetical protein [Gammaproteobacteria bacterium]